MSLTKRFRLSQIFMPQITVQMRWGIMCVGLTFLMGQEHDEKSHIK